MKVLLFVFLSVVMVCAGEKPTVGVYMVRAFDQKAVVPEMPEVILEISNPTDKTFYISGSSIESPLRHVEALRGERWLRIPGFVCGTGLSMRPLKPGSKMLVTVNFPLEEVAARFRFFFFTSANSEEAEVFSVWSRGIEKKELGDLSGTVGELTSDKELEEPELDGEVKKDVNGFEGGDNPFGE